MAGGERYFISITPKHPQLIVNVAWFDFHTQDTAFHTQPSISKFSNLLLPGIEY